MQRICTALAENGYTVLLVGRKLPHSVELTNRPYEQKRMTCFFNQFFLFYAEYNIRLFFLLLFTSAKIICSIDLDTVLPGFIVAKLRNKVFVHDAHELFSEMPELNENKIAKGVWKKIEQFVFPKLSYAYTESEGYQNVYKSKYPSTEFKVIRNVPFYFHTERTADDGSYILYQGALNVGRGLEESLIALQEVDYPLWLAGEGDVSQQLREQVRRLNLENKVKFLGWVKPKDLRDITLQAKIGLNLLNPDNRHYRLSFPNKLFDYIMAQLPQVSMNFPAYQQIVQKKNIGFLIDDLKPETIATNIQQLLSDKDYYANCIRNCADLKEQHNWNKEQQKLIRFYNDLPL